MTLLVAIPTAVGAAVVSGASTAVQHSVARAGKPGVRGVLGLLRRPRWLASLGGDAASLVLQVIALATGPVVLVQPLLVLGVPVALLVGRALGGRGLSRRDTIACLAILAALGTFFGLVGNPGPASPVSGAVALTLSCATLAAGAAVCLAVRGRSSPVKAGVYGAVAGGGFAVAAVLIGAVSAAWPTGAGLARADVLVPIAGTIGVGGSGMVLAQIAFQAGPLAASFPAMESAAPFIAVVLGALILRERVPLAGPYVVGYVLCLAAVVFGTTVLARAGFDGHGHGGLEGHGHDEY